MKIDEIISKAESFALSFMAKLSDKNEQPERKQVFLMDNHETLHKYLDALQKIVTTGTETTEEMDDDTVILVQKAQEILTNLKATLSDYQKDLQIDSDTSEEKTTAILTEDTIAGAMQTNKTTQEISANMAAIADQQSAANATGFTHMMICDGNMFMINGADKASLEAQINGVTDGKQYKSIQLFEMKLKPIPLKKKTIFSV